ncbi:MAG: phage holin family protein [Deferribacterales bacterium]
MISLQFILYRYFVNVIGLGVAALLFKHVTVDSFATLLLSGLVLSIVNFFLKPFLVFITLPVQVLTMGLFYFVINAIIVMMVSYMVNGLVVDGFWTAIGVSLIVSIVNLLFDSFYSKPKINITIRRF